MMMITITMTMTMMMMMSMTIFTKLQRKLQIEHFNDAKSFTMIIYQGLFQIKGRVDLQTLTKISFNLERNSPGIFDLCALCVT